MRTKNMNSMYLPLINFSTYINKVSIQKHLNFFLTFFFMLPSHPVIVPNIRSCNRLYWRVQCTYILLVCLQLEKYLNWFFPLCYFSFLFFPIYLFLRLLYRTYISYMMIQCVAALCFYCLKYEKKKKNKTKNQAVFH